MGYLEKYHINDKKLYIKLKLYAAWNTGCWYVINTIFFNDLEKQKINMNKIPKTFRFFKAIFEEI